LSHAISQTKAPRALPPAIVIALVVACFVGFGALLVGALSRASTLNSAPAVHTANEGQLAPADPARPPRVHRDPGAPGRRF
jgi:hypothetical protein